MLKRPIAIVLIAAPMIVWGIIVFGFTVEILVDGVASSLYQRAFAESAPLLVTSAIFIGTGLGLLRGRNTARLICAGICFTLMIFAFLMLGEDPVYASLVLFSSSFVTFDQLFRPHTIDYFAQPESVRSLFAGVVPRAPETFLVGTHQVPAQALSYRPIQAPLLAHVLAWLIAVAAIVPGLVDVARYPALQHRYRTGYQQISYGASTDHVYELMGTPTNIDYLRDGRHLQDCVGAWSYGDCTFGWDRRDRHNSDTGKIVLTFDYRTPVVRDRWIIGFNYEGRAIAKYDPDD